MAFYQNKANGPRVFALKGGRRFTLLPGQSGEMELARGPDEDPVLKGWLEKGELVEADPKKLEAEAAEADKALPKAEEVFAAQAKIREALERQRAQELDLERKTPPRQFAGDGGPQQDGTVDGASGGALTPNQEKGRPELPPVEQAQVSTQRHVEMTARAEKADAEKKAAEARAAEAKAASHKGR
jgi:hypothetical protein